jgi:membrane protein DedA with SNARE-associated domain
MPHCHPKASTSVSLFPHDFLVELVRAYGYSALGVLIALECLGLPLPGETLLIGGALLATRSQQINIHMVVLSAALGAVVGQAGGYAIGYTLGYRLLRRYGARVGLTAPRLALGRLLFRRHGVKVVVVSRFVALLRSLAGLLAGATHMSLTRFMAANVVGSVLWAGGYGYGAAALGDTLKRVAGPLALVLGIAVAIAVVAGVVFIRRHEQRLTDRGIRRAQV